MKIHFRLLPQSDRAQESSERSGFPVFAALAALAFVVSSCIPTNGNFNPSKKSKARPTSSTSTTAEEDGAQGVCTSLDESSPDRRSCIACYDELLASKCPGKESPDDCADKTVASTFSNLVNQCLATAIQSGFVCTKTCSSGQVLNASICACEAQSSGTGGNVIIDSGERDYGPPIVSLYVPESTSSVVGNVCTAQLLPQFYVRNRGETTSRFNIYRHLTPVTTNCTAPVMAITNAADILSASAPTFHSPTQTIQGAVELRNPTGNIAGDLAVAEEDSGTMTGSGTFSHNLSPGTYELSIDLRLFNDWKGNIQDGVATPDYFEVKIQAQAGLAAEKTLFKQTFSNDPIAATDPTYQQSYSPRASADANTMVDLDGGAAANGYSLDSRYMLHLTFVQPGTGAATRPIDFDYEGKKSFRAIFQIKPLQTCAAKYSFTDSNNLSSYYCYRFTPRTLKTITDASSPTPFEDSCYAVPLAQRYWTAVGEAEDCLNNLH